jgi:hypothetical protein
MVIIAIVIVIDKLGIIYGETDLAIQCPFHRLYNPRAQSYKDFQADIAARGMVPLLTDVFAWPAILLQKGFFKALIKREGLDTTNLDNLLVGILSHRDLMWPNREELQKVLESKQDRDGTIDINDIWGIKDQTAKKEGMEMSNASFLEIPLVFLHCGGNVNTGR